MSDEKVLTATEIEDFDEVDVVEVLVSAGDKIEKNQSIVTLESDKAMMEFPSTDSGVVKSVAVSVGDKIKQGDQLLTLVLEASEAQVNKSESKVVTDSLDIAEENPQIAPTEKKQQSSSYETKSPIENDKAYASPAVRKYASELGVNLDDVTGSAKQGRVLKKDVQQHVQNQLTGSHNVKQKSDYVLPEFDQFGDTEIVGLNKLRQVSANHLHHAWDQAPHVTQFDEADITELESTRKQLKQSVADQGAKLTLLPFVMKVLIDCLKEFPDFNSSLNEDITALIHKKYFNLGIAVDTPRGLVVPVIRDVDSKKITTLAKELYEISQLARDGKLTPKHMQGGCMTITSLGGIGGQHFTPIINYPEVAILGVSRTQKKLVKDNEKIQERLMLPLSLSYDHRAIDGVAAVKFITSLKNKLSDVWSLMV